MTILEYIQNLNRLKELALSRWANLSGLEREIVDSSYEWLVDNLNIKRGTIQADEDLTAAMDNFLLAVLEIVKSNGTFQGRLTSYLGDLSTIRANMGKFHATTNNFDIERAGVTEAQRTVVNEIIEQYEGNGLNAHFATPLRDLIFRQTLIGMDMKEAKQVLQTYILSGQDRSGKLGQYLTQTAQQGVDSYTGMLNMKINNAFTFTGFIISGSLIETSSKQCVYAVDHAKRGYLPFKEWEKVLDIARDNQKARLIPGTTLENLPLNKLHWGCRHDFTPVVIKT
jgi:hypothetical protein